MSVQTGRRNPRPIQEVTINISPKTKRILAGGAAVSALAVGGAAIANAASSDGGTTTTPNGPSGQQGVPQQRSDETPLTGDTATQVEHAALAKTGGGTVVRVETDADGHAPYEAHIVKSDGSEVTVYVDKQFNVVGVEQGHPRGGGRGNEQPLTGSMATQAEQAALAETGGGTVLRAETDSSGISAYEVHIRKTDGTDVTVHLDKQLNVVSVDSHGPHGTPQGPTTSNT